MWKGIVCLLILLLCGCGAQTLTQRFNNDTGQLLKYLASFSSRAEPRTYKKTLEWEIYGANGKSYYFNTTPTDDKIILCGGTYQRKDVYFRYDAEYILYGYLIAENIITTKKDFAFTERAFNDASSGKLQHYFYEWLEADCYILTREDILVLEMEDKLDDMMNFRKEWNKQKIKVLNPQRKRNLEKNLMKIKNLK